MPHSCHNLRSEVPVTNVKRLLHQDIFTRSAKGEVKVAYLEIDLVSRVLRHLDGLNSQVTVYDVLIVEGFHTLRNLSYHKRDLILC